VVEVDLAWADSEEEQGLVAAGPAKAAEAAKVEAREKIRCRK
jgi:hypothetical protein